MRVAIFKSKAGNLVVELAKTSIKEFEFYVKNFELICYTTL